MFQTPESPGNSTQKRSSRTKVKVENERKIFVLDTSVILYDHNAIKSFQEHDVVIPITVLEELDNFKKGNDMINYEAREFIRILDDLVWRKISDEPSGRRSTANHMENLWLPWARRSF